MTRVETQGPVGLLLDHWVLESPLPRGGTSHVWVGRDRRTGQQAAVKVLTGLASGPDAAMPFFVREIRALSSVCHPNILNLLDYGVVSESAGAASDGHLVPGSPYLVVEYAAGGSLVDDTRVFSWPELRAILRCVLRALAHAHARGMLHRDIKPENLLYGSAERRPDDLRLGDFGIAHIMPAENVFGGRFTFSTGERVLGTVQYMAPEQIERDWLHYGPPTDLYAVGILAWELACGRPPFDGESRLEVAEKQRRQPLPILEPLSPVPDGFEAWVHRMTRKAARLRYQRAADALVALDQLDEAPTEALEPQEDPAEALMRSLQPSWGRLPALPAGREGSAPLDTLPRTRAIAYRPEVRPPAQDPPQAQMPQTRTGALASTRRVRELALDDPTDASEAKSALWMALQRVFDRATPEAVVLEMRPDRAAQMARWLVHHADEFGCASHLHTTFHMRPQASDGLAFTLAARLRLFGGHPDEYLVDQAVQAMQDVGMPDAEERQSLAEWIVPSSRLDRWREGHGVSTPGPQRASVVRLLRRLAEERPMVLWIQGEGSPDELQQLLREVLRAPAASSALLVILTPAPDAETGTPVVGLPTSMITSGRITRVHEAEPGGRITSGPPQVVDALSLARSCFRSGDIDTAYVLATDVVRRLSPGDGGEASADGFALEVWNVEALLGDIALTRRHFREASAHFQRAWDHLHAKARHVEARERAELELRSARTFRQIGMLGRAIDMAESATRRFGRTGIAHLTAEGLYEQAQIHFESGNWAYAGRYYDEALGVAQSASDPGLVALCRLGLGKLELVRSEYRDWSGLRDLLEHPDGASESCLDRGRVLMARHVVRYNSGKDLDVLATHVLRPLSTRRRPPVRDEAHLLLLGCQPGLDALSVVGTLQLVAQSLQLTGAVRRLLAEDLLWLASARVEPDWQRVRVQAAGMALAQYEGLHDAAGIRRCRSILDP